MGARYPFFTSSDADPMTNGDKTGILVSIACDCAALGLGRAVTASPSTW